MNKKRLGFIEAVNKAINIVEDRILRPIFSAMDKAFNLLMKGLKRIFNLDDNTEPTKASERAYIIIGKLKDKADLLKNKDLLVEREIKKLIRTSDGKGKELAKELLKSYREEIIEKETQKERKESVLSQIGINRDASARIRKWGREYEQKFSNVINEASRRQWGYQRTKKILGNEYQTTKNRIRGVAETTSIKVANDRLIKEYRKNKVELGQWIATGDDRTCPFCGYRNMNVYRLDEVIFPAHVKCRCYLAPFTFEWLDNGLIDIKYNIKLKKQTEGIRKDSGLTPFERTSGLTNKPMIIWNPFDADT